MCYRSRHLEKQSPDKTVRPTSLGQHQRQYRQAYLVIPVFQSWLRLHGRDRRKWVRCYAGRALSVRAAVFPVTVAGLLFQVCADRADGQAKDLHPFGLGYANLARCDLGRGIPQELCARACGRVRFGPQADLLVRGHRRLGLWYFVAGQIAGRSCCRPIHHSRAGPGNLSRRTRFGGLPVAFLGISSTNTTPFGCL